MRNKTTTILRNSEYFSVLIIFWIIYYFLFGRNQLPLSWIVTPTVYIPKVYMETDKAVRWNVTSACAHYRRICNCRGKGRQT